MSACGGWGEGPDLVCQEPGARSQLGPLLLGSPLPLSIAFPRCQLEKTTPPPALYTPQISRVCRER